VGVGNKLFFRFVGKLVFRALLLATAVVLFFVDREKLNFVTVIQQGAGGVFLWLIWASLVIDMLYRVFSNRRIAIGARKHFACSYQAVSHAEITPENRRAVYKRLNKGALLSAVGWFIISAATLFALCMFGVLTPAVVLILVLLYAVLDLVFILFFCPFQALFMRNRCCAVCRIYNWDYFMMCAPMILFPSVYSLGLVALAALVVLRWEVALYKNPHFFVSETNENLRCEACTDRVCRFHVVQKKSASFGR
jgi:hypothetical protein